MTQEEKAETKTEEVSPEKEQHPSMEKELIESKEKYLRTLAELENVRKRMQKEKREAISFATENIICEFIPIIDNFEKALKYSENMSSEVKSWAAGFQMFLTQLKDILHNHGIVAFHSEGNFFDPYYHEAVETEETNDHPDGLILEEYSKGYKNATRIVRPARVKVAKQLKEESKKMTEEKGEENNE